MTEKHRAMVQRAVKATVGLKDVEVRQNVFDRVLGALLAKRDRYRYDHRYSQCEHLTPLSGPLGNPEAD